MYESPIEKIVGYVQSQLVESEESELMTKITQTIGYHIDKDELIRALQYDRQQYEKGYADGVSDAKPRWVPVSEKLPEEAINPITQDYYAYPCTYKRGKVCEVRYYCFGNGHWWHGPGIMDESIVAWMPLPEPYQEEE